MKGFTCARDPIRKAELRQIEAEIENAFRGRRVLGACLRDWYLDAEHAIAVTSSDCIQKGGMG